jgi:signal transduction histidine kinase
MAEQVNHLRDALADRAYLSGMSEWAAGTLHNVRNGLNPVSVVAWRLRQLFDAVWLKNVKTALEEHERPDVSADRREKLKAYVFACAPRMLSTTEEAKDLSRQIDEANTAVLDIMTEFEKYTRQESKLEPVDLRPLVEDVSKTALQQSPNKIELILPVESATVFGNRTILRQVLSNILLNAVEAIEGQGRPGRIVAALKTLDGAAGGVRLSISDNGEGLAPDRLKAIFERGVSSRQHKKGGLGLHWCANAMDVLGGSICAESDGPGQGATFVLRIPTKETNLKQAA